MEDEFYSCAKIIEFFWMFLSFLLFAFVIYTKFRLKKDVHLDQENLNSNRPEQKYQPTSQQGINQQNEIHIVGGDNMQQSGQLQHIDQQSKEPPTKLEEIYLKILKISSTIFPLLTVSILCILNGASFTFSVVCVFLYFASILLFNILNVQQCLGSQGIKNVFKLINNVWLICLFANYLASSQN